MLKNKRSLDSPWVSLALFLIFKKSNQFPTGFISLSILAFKQRWYWRGRYLPMRAVMLSGVSLKGRVPRALYPKHLSSSELLEGISAVRLPVMLPCRLSHIKEQRIFGSWEGNWAVEKE